MCVVAGSVCQIKDQESVYHKEAMHNCYHMVGFGREPNTNGEDPDTLGHISKGCGCTIEIGGKLAQPDLTYQIYEKHFVGYQKYRNKDGDKPANSERTLQMAKEKW